MWWWCWAAPDSSRESRRPAKRVRLQQTHSAQCCVHEDDGSQARQGPARWAVWLPPRLLAAGGAPGALGGCRNGGRRPGDRLGGRRRGGAATCHLRECTRTGRCCLCAPPPVTELRAVWPTWMPAARRRMSGASRRPAATPPSQRLQPRCRCLPPTRVASWQRLSHRTRTRRLTPRTAAAPQALWPAPAFVCLNEVDLAKQPGALETVADALGGMTVSFYGHVADADGVERYGNALLSRWPPAALRKVRRQLLHGHPLHVGLSPETAGPFLRQLLPCRRASDTGLLRLCRCRWRAGQQWSPAPAARTGSTGGCWVRRVGHRHSCSCPLPAHLPSSHGVAAVATAASAPEPPAASRTASSSPPTATVATAPRLHPAPSASYSGATILQLRISPAGLSCPGH